ncbi:glycosyltransferase family 15 protein [Hebeloma cylindrosporum]|uniref:Glycosyltransferase family 15 protein n=1 Tax=Hebeloma cylindrosporum TaxID=76867 RepID=A0A0C2Y9Q1_HEBCY|nr:glycosyltransferase family 15 protein [Hebeloma cylindrosporum h7]
MNSLSLRPGPIALLILGLIFSLHLLASFTHEEYGRVTSISRIASKLSPNKSTFTGNAFPNDQIYSDKRANATFVILCRNNQLWDTVRSVREIEDRFNNVYHYPYVFLNEVPFTEEFKYRLSSIVSSKAEFGLIPRDHWFQPDWIDEDKAKKSRDKMQSENIIYGGSLSYRNMCRFNSGFFFRHPLMQKYKWYWRIEPDVHFHCDITFDPFRYMEEQNKIYAFTISMVEYEATIPTLWGHVRDFVQKNPQYVAKNNYMGFISDNAGEKYNLCHFWSNFEIANMEFWRGEAYMNFFEYLDSKGGFYYERWGDAPVHSIAAAIFASRDQIHFFDEIGYEHAPYTHCPKERDHWKRGRCSCNPKTNFDFDGVSCLDKYVKFIHT